ncbi:hypothetical protein FJZ31_24385 [Candidatus Poribacteria bacterium]|nr:hypothetical protein [Candidatus Poribacteria bacterium]
MNYKSFAERTKDKTFDELVHEGKRRAHELIEDQGIAALALYIADIMSKNIELFRSPTYLKEVKLILVDQAEQLKEL